MRHFTFIYKPKKYYYLGGTRGRCGWAGRCGCSAGHGLACCRRVTRWMAGASGPGLHLLHKGFEGDDIFKYFNLVLFIVTYLRGSMCLYFLLSTCLYVHTELL